MLVDLLVGRDQVLNSVEAQLDAVRYGTAARALVITGVPGTGRSSVLQVAAARAARDGWAVGVASIGAQDNLAAALDRALELALRQCPPGAGFARVSGARRRFVQEAAASPFELSEALSQLLPVLAAEPGVPRVAVFLDDLHRATPAACQALLEGLTTMASTGAPVGLIPSYALESHEELPFPRPAEVDERRLGPLGRNELVELASRFGLVLDAAAAAVVEERSAGIAGDAVAILRRVCDSLYPTAIQLPVEQPAGRLALLGDAR